MARNPKHDVLFEPVQIGPKVAKNRFWQPPQCNGAGTQSPGFNAHHRGMKAEGGYGVVFTELIGIAPECACDPYVLPDLWDDNDVLNLRLATDAIHAGGALAGAELGYYKVTGGNPMSRKAAFGVTETNSDWALVQHGGSHKQFQLEDVDDIVQIHADAVRRAIAAGYDLVSLQMAHAATIAVRSLMRYYNKRTDEYGGSFENRIRLAKEILFGMRDAADGKVALGVRFHVNTLDFPFGLGPEGITREEGFATLEALDDLVDFWDLTVGGGAWGEDAGSSRTHPENHQAPYLLGAKEHTSKPIANVGRFTNPDTMVEAIRSGQCDLIATARPSISDPFLPSKISEGRLDDIRECIGCNICASTWERGVRIVCTQNATAGEEYRRGWHPEKFEPATNRDMTVLVVGAGPAGMECARVLGERKMAGVHLVEAGDDVGGSLRWISRLPGRGEWGRVTDYRKVQLEKLENVQVILNTRLSAEDVLDYGADLVVIATGSTWDSTGVSWYSQSPLPVSESAGHRVLTPEDIMVKGVVPGERVVVFDADNYYMGHGLAQRLASSGHSVTMVTESETIASFTQYTLEQPRVLAELRELGVEMLVGTEISEISDGKVVLTYGVNREERVLDFDSLVVVSQRWADNGLYRELRGMPDDLAAKGIHGLFVIGDCEAPALIADAVFSGHRLAREIDSPNPAEPLPFIRERRVVGRGDEAYKLPR